MDVYHVTVTATRDQNRSEAVKSKTFSFNPVKTSFVQCEYKRANVRTGTA